MLISIVTNVNIAIIDNKIVEKLFVIVSYPLVKNKLKTLTTTRTALVKITPILSVLNQLRIAMMRPRHNAVMDMFILRNQKMYDSIFMKYHSESSLNLI